MATQPSFIEVGYSEVQNDAPTPNEIVVHGTADGGNVEVVGVVELTIVGEVGGEHVAEDVAELNDNILVDPFDHDDDGAEPVNEILLSVLSKNRAGTWFSSQRARNPLWSFFCPTDHSLGWEERGKSSSIDCLICHAQR